MYKLCDEWEIMKRLSARGIGASVEFPADKLKIDRFKFRPSGEYSRRGSINLFQLRSTVSIDRNCLPVAKQTPPMLHGGAGKSQINDTAFVSVPAGDE